MEWKNFSYFVDCPHIYLFISLCRLPSLQCCGITVLYSIYDPQNPTSTFWRNATRQHSCSWFIFIENNWTLSRSYLKIIYAFLIATLSPAYPLLALYHFWSKAIFYSFRKIINENTEDYCNIQNAAWHNLLC